MQSRTIADPRARFSSAHVPVGPAVDMVDAIEAAMVEVDAHPTTRHPMLRWPADILTEWVASPTAETRWSSRPSGRSAADPSTRRLGARLGDRAAIQVIPSRITSAGGPTRPSIRGGRLFGLMAAAGICAAVLGGTAIGGAIGSWIQPTMAHSRQYEPRANNALMRSTSTTRIAGLDRHERLDPAQAPGR